MKKVLLSFAIAFFVINAFSQTNIFPTTGNVGIGTTTPRTRLSVSNSNSVFEINPGSTTTIEAIDLLNTGSSVNTALYTRNGYFAFNTGGYQERLRIANDGNVGIGTTTPITKLHVHVQTEGNLGVRIPQLEGISSGVQLNSFSDDGNSNLPMEFKASKFVWSVSGNEQLRIAQNGNVGIGTTTPSYKLDINGNLRLNSGRPITLENSGAINIQGDAGGWAYGLFAKGSSGTDRGGFGFLGGADNLSYYYIGSTYNNPVMTILPLGNVGIGITNPLTKLHIEGSSANWDESTPGLAVGSIHMSTGTSNDHFGNAITWGASDASGAQAGIYTRSDGTYGTKMYFATTDSYATGSKTRMFINADGRVGIGTTEPSSLFHIRKDVANNIGPTILLHNNQYENNSTNAGSSIRFTGAIPGRFIEIKGIMGGWALPEKISFNLNGLADDNCVGEAMVINRSGNVGIGTTNPQSKLAVNGVITAKEINVTLDGWADFVFKPNYNLRPLSEVEQFVKTNNHLPEIPSEKEVKENGVNLGEMNAKLLQKVEELTLYMIEMKKENEGLKSRIEQLEKKK